MSSGSREFPVTKKKKKRDNNNNEKRKKKKKESEVRERWKEKISRVDNHK